MIREPHDAVSRNSNRRLRPAEPAQGLRESGPPMHDVQWLRAALDASSESVFCVDPRRLTFIDVNRAACDNLGFTVDELMQMGPVSLRPHLAVAQQRVQFEAIIRQGSGHERIATTQRCRNGVDLPVWWDIHVTGEADQPVLVIVARRRGDKEALPTTASARTGAGDNKAAGGWADAERYRLAAQCVEDGVWDWDLDLDEIHCSAQWFTMTGRMPSSEPIRQKDWLAMLHPKDRGRVLESIEMAFAGTASRWEHEHRVQHASGGYRWVLVRAVVLRNEDGKPTRLVGSQTDISWCHRVESQMRRRRLWDPVTRLPDRRLFQRRLARALQRAQRHREYRFAVLFVDLDQFKGVNDRLGHRAGDRLLRRMAARLLRSVRPGDMVSRRGGDEFTILVDDLCDERDVFRVAQRICREAERPIRLGDAVVRVSASVGIALNSSDCRSAGELIDRADRAMYEAKSKSNASYRLYRAGVANRAG